MSLLPAPPPALFATRLADTSATPPSIDALLSPNFSIAVNGNANTAPATVRQQIVEAVAQQKFITMVLLVDGLLKPFFLPFRRSQAAGDAPDPSIDNKIFAFDGELINGEGVLIELTDNLFTQVPNQVQVSTVAETKAQLTANTAPDFMMGPFAAAAGDTTETIKARFINVIPSQYASLFINNQGGISPRYYFETILPLIEADGNEAAMLPLTRTVQIALTRHAAGNDTSALQVVQPACPPRNAPLTIQKQRLLKTFFPQLDPASAASAAIQPIAHGILSLHQQKEEHYNRLQQEKAYKAATSVSSWCGAENTKQLLLLCCIGDESQLPDVWPNMAAAKQKDQLSILQGAIREQLRMMGENRLAETLCVSPNFLANLIMMSWAMLTSDSLDTGSLGNAFMFGDSDVEKSHMLMKKMQLIQSGGAAPSLSDVDEIMKMKVNLPGEEESIRSIVRLEGVLRAVLPIGHPATAWVAAHHKTMKDFEHDWQNHVMDGNLGLKGVCHLKWVSARLTQYWRKQAQTAVPVVLPSPSEIVDKIERQESWAPLLSATFVRTYKIDALTRLNRQLGVPDDATTATGMSTLSGNTGLAGSAISGSAGGGRGGNGDGNAGSLGGISQNTRVENPSFNVALFQSYKVMPVKCRDLRGKISSNVLPALPCSKVTTNRPMCLAWHTKGVCNTGCPIVADHVAYSSGEYAELSAWCAECYNHGSE